MKIINFLMLLLYSFIFIVAAVSAQETKTLSTQSSDNQSARAVKNPELREELLKRLNTARAMREELSKKSQGMINSMDARGVIENDRENISWLKPLVEKNGWLGKSLVGDDGEAAAFQLVRSAITDNGFQKQCLELLQKAANDGEAPAAQVEELADIIRRTGNFNMNSNGSFSGQKSGAPVTLSSNNNGNSNSNSNSNSGDSRNISTQPIKNPQLREELLKRMKADQDIRAEAIGKYPVGQPLPDEVVQRFKAIDKDNTEWLKKIIAENGYPGFSMVGRDGEQAAFLIVQHAAADLEFQKQTLELIRKAVAQKDASPTSLAYLTDRLLTIAGKSQIYGTQMRVSNGKSEPFPIEDEVNVDKRRAEIGLPPLAEYLKTIQQRYEKPSN